MNSKESLKKSLFTEAFTRNPYPAYSILREEEPIARVLLPDGQHAWMITRYEDALDALKDQRFIKDFTKLGGGGEYDSIFTQNMLFADMPDHRRLRGLVSKAFTPRMISGLRERIQEITDELLDEMEGKESLDLINEFAFPLPIIVICEMLGIPTEDRDKFRLWSNALIEDGTSGEIGQEIEKHMNDFVQYLGERFAIARENPGDDLISKLIIAEEQGEQLTEKELYGVVSLLIIAGHETTVNLIGNSILALLEHPDQLELLQSEPELIHTAVEESLRYNDPVEFSTSRWAGEDLEFKGQSMSKGDLVIVVLNSANHDPTQFKNPEVFDITREKSKHLAFGKGIHACLGAPLARLEGEIAIGSFIKRYPDSKLNVNVADLKWRSGMVVRGVRELPVKLR